MMVFVTEFALTARTHTKLVANNAARLQAELAAESGVNIAIAHLLTGRHKPAGFLVQAFEGGYHCALEGGTQLAISVRDEGGKIDLNSSPPHVLALLFSGLGADPNKALALSDAILDFRDQDDTPRDKGAEREAYQGSGLKWAPKNAPFAAVEELEQVLGVDAQLYHRVRPMVTVHSRQASPDLRAASHELRTILQAPSSLPPIRSGSSQRVAYTIRVAATLTGGANFIREAIAEIPRSRFPPFRLRSWRQQFADEAKADRIDAGASGALPPPCLGGG